MMKNGRRCLHSKKKIIERRCLRFFNFKFQNIYRILNLLLLTTIIIRLLIYILNNYVLNN